MTERPRPSRLRLLAIPVALHLTATAAGAQARAPCRGAGADVEEGWARYRADGVDEAGSLFERALQACPGHPGALTGTAYVALRDDDPERADRLFTTVLAGSPDHVDALVGRGLARSRLGNLEGAEHAFARAHDLAPDSRDAHVGLARVVGWQGRFEESERLFAAAVERWPDDPEAYLGLAQALDGQGRARGAGRVLQEAARVAPDSEAVRALLTNRARARRPRATTSFVYESDSDGNRIRSSNLRVAWQPAPGVEVRGDAYLRESKVDRRFYHVRRAGGLHMGVASYFGAGWQLRGGLGGAESNVPGSDLIAAVDVSLTTPRRHPVTAVLAFSQSPLDATSLLIERGVRVRSWTAEAAVGRDAGPEARVIASYSDYRGVRSNRRWYTNGQLGWTAVPWLEVGVDATLLGFRDDLSDGYFDPSLYALMLLPVQGRAAAGAWTATLRVAPGVEHIDGTPGARGALRTEADVSWAGPRGLTLSVGSIYSTTSVQALGTDEYGYRYLATTAALGWRF